MQKSGMSKDAMGKDGMKKDGMAKDAMSKDGMSKDGMSKGGMAGRNVEGRDVEGRMSKDGCRDGMSKAACKDGMSAPARATRAIIDMEQDRPGRADQAPAGPAIQARASHDTGTQTLPGHGAAAALAAALAPHWAAARQPAAASFPLCSATRNGANGSAARI